MPSHPDPSLHNRHHLYLGDSGSGKSQAVKQNKGIPNSGARVLLWDPGLDHAGTRFTVCSEFAEAVIQSIRSGKGFRVAFTPKRRTVELHEWFCEFVLSVLDGRHSTYVIDEEISRSVNTVSKAPEWFAELMNEGRKYGLRYHGTTQFPQEIPKTIYRNCRVIWAGLQDLQAVTYVATSVGVTPEQISGLKPLEFYVRDKDHVPPLRREKLVYQR